MSSQLQRIADSIFYGDVRWDEHKLADDILTSVGTVQGVSVTRRVDKRAGKTYGDATYVARIGEKDERFRVSDAAGVRVPLQEKG